MTGGAAAYLYDIDNKMTSATVGRVTTSLTYDPLGRLYSVTSASGTRRFLYAPGDSGLPEVLEEYDGSGGLVGLYAHGPGPDEPLIWEDPGIAYRSLHADERGSVIAAGDGAGGAYAINRYDEYGTPQGGNAGRFQYTGQAWLGEIGLQYSRARTYSPALGRFMQTDPIGPADDANIYQYALNDPVNNVDPTGLCGSREISVRTGGYTSFDPNDPSGPVDVVVILTCIDTATGSLVSPTYSFGGTQDSIPPSEPITPQPQPQPQPHRAVKPNLRPENRSLCTGVVAGGAGYILTNEAKEAAALRGFSLYGRILTGAEFGAIEGGGLFSLEGLVGGAAVGGVTYVLDRWSGNTGAEALTRDQGLCR